MFTFKSMFRKLLRHLDRENITMYKFQTILRSEIGKADEQLFFHFCRSALVQTCL